MEADHLASDLLRELLAPPCLDPESLRQNRCQPEPRPLVLRSLWPVCHDSVTILRLLQETEEGQARAPTQATQARGTFWEPMAQGSSGPRTMARSSKNKQTPGQESLGTPAGPSQRRPRKQLKPRQGAERVDPGFKGVTLKFQIKADSSLQISPTYSGPELGAPLLASDCGPLLTSDLAGPRRCASCRTQRTPLWRDAEDGTPLCNACGIRYKKYGTRCSGCWLVPRKTVQPKKLCGRCGVSLGPLEGPPQAM
uniref:GATA-type zinc finger protein 1 n=1 Tax=Chinchilla lanigera TaxID=34839 RepID=A0A8C2V2W9_CHILA